jgi:hypothetical protein
MKRVDFLMLENQFRIIARLDGTISGHIRQAIDDYLKKINKNSSSISPSRKGGKQNG